MALNYTNLSNNFALGDIALLDHDAGHWPFSTKRTAT